MVYHSRSTNLNAQSGEIKIKSQVIFQSPGGGVSMTSLSMDHLTVFGGAVLVVSELFIVSVGVVTYSLSQLTVPCDWS